jgi:hypothetical protein
VAALRLACSKCLAAGELVVVQQMAWRVLDNMHMHGTGALMVITERMTKTWKCLLHQALKLTAAAEH